MIVKFKKLREGAEIPEFQTAGSAGADLRACLDKPVVLAPMERAMIPLGFAMEIEAGCEAQIRARSGLSIKHGITLINGVGTIDADYRGEVGVLLVNLGNEDFVIENGARIAQMVFARYETPKVEIVAELSDTVRGGGGFGSTGV